MFIFIRYSLFFYDQAPLCYFFTGIPIIFLIIIIVITELTVQSINFPSINQKEISSSQPLSLRKGGSGVISSNGEAFQLWNIFRSPSSCLRLHEEGLNSKYRVGLVPPVVVVAAALSSFWAAVAPCWRTEAWELQPRNRESEWSSSRTDKQQPPRDVGPDQNNTNAWINQSSAVAHEEELFSCQHQPCNCV